VNKSFEVRKDHLSVQEEFSDENTRNSKYRLISLEKKFENQKNKSKDKLDSVTRRMTYLQNANQ
jgi:hypothetical protein